MRRLDWPHHNQTDEEWLWLLSDYNMKLYNRNVMQSWRSASCGAERRKTTAASRGHQGRAGALFHDQCAGERLPPHPRSGAIRCGRGFAEGLLAHHPSPLSKCHSRLQPPLAIGREQWRDLPDDAKKACYPDCGGSPCGRGATDSCGSKLAIEWRNDGSGQLSVSERFSLRSVQRRARRGVVELCW
jgi:hypothetical protein